MKALLYKEFKLAMHPMCYIFIALFPFMILVPPSHYPIGIGFIYVLSCYPVLFLGANKGQQSNDLLYSTLLPVRKKDIVLARILTVAIMQFAFIAIMSALLPIAYTFIPYIEEQVKEGSTEALKFGLNGYTSLLAIALVGYSIADLIFFPIYYKNGKSIVLSTLMTILGFVFYYFFFVVGLPFMSQGFCDYVCNGPIWFQLTLLGSSLLLYVVIRFAVYRISSKRLENVDF